MKALSLIPILLLITSTAFSAELDAVSPECQTKLENLAKSVSLQLGRSRDFTIGFAHPTEINGGDVVVYIGSDATFDRYEYTVGFNCQVTNMIYNGGQN